MAVSKAKKAESLKKIEKIAKDSKSIVFVNFHGLPVNDTNAMRKLMTKSDIGYTVAKKTLIKKALTGITVSGVCPEFVGELALAYGEDLIAPAREVYAVEKKNKDKFKILGGIFNGEYKNAEEMIAIASIPSRETLYAQFVNVINSPIQGFVMALDAIAKKKV